MATKINLIRLVKLLLYVESVFCLAIVNEGYSQDDTDNIELLFESKYEAWIQYYINTPSSNPGSGEFDFELYFDNEPFRELVELGVSAVPFMIEKQQENHILGYALYLITKFKWTTTRHGSEPGEWYWVVEEFPDIWSDSGPPDSRTIWLRWWNEGQKFTDQRFEVLYNEWIELKQKNNYEQAEEKYQRIIDLGIAALPCIVKKIEHGDTELISAVSVLTDGRIAETATSAEVLTWWQTNQHLWLIPFENGDTPQLYGGGTGDPNDPYLIFTAEHMNAIGANPNDWDKDFKLMADIDMNQCKDAQLNLIGYNGSDVGLSPDKEGFSGVFDGNGYRISNVAYISTGLDSIGLFRHLDDHHGRRRAIIKNLGLIDPNIDAGTGDYVGALVGYFRNGLIMGCYIHGGRVSGNEHVGGLVGGTINAIGISYSPRLEIFDCHAMTTVSGTEWIGGLIGSYEVSSHSILLETSVLSKCYAMGNVSGTTGVGGLAGVVVGGPVINCYAQSQVSASHTVGGLIGRSCAIVDTCYSTGGVIGTEEIGGLIGSTATNGLFGIIEAQTKNSYWDVEVTGQITSNGGEGKTTIEMMQRATFVNWDFIEVWDIAENQTYPFLRQDPNYEYNVDMPNLAIPADHQPD